LNSPLLRRKRVRETRVLSSQNWRQMTWSGAGGHDRLLWRMRSNSSIKPDLCVHTAIASIAMCGTSSSTLSMYMYTQQQKSGSLVHNVERSSRPASTLLCTSIESMASSIGNTTNCILFHKQTETQVQWFHYSEFVVICLLCIYLLISHLLISKPQFVLKWMLWIQLLRLGLALDVFLNLTWNVPGFITNRSSSTLHFFTLHSHRVLHF